MSCGVLYLHDLCGGVGTFSASVHVRLVYMHRDADEQIDARKICFCRSLL